MRPFTPPSARLLVHAAGLSLVVAGAVTWARLLTPAAAPVRAAPAQAAVADPTADALAAWFGPGEVRANIAVKGLIKGAGQAGVAVLSVNDGAPQPYRVGDALGRALTLAGIEADAVTVDKAGTSLRIAAPVLPTAPGIVRAAP
ncbi:MAG: type II secretion system protein N [Pseudomonadota bacterium]